MSSFVIVDFLIDLNKTDSLVVLKNASSQKSVLVFKLAEFSQLQQTKIDYFLDKKVILGKEVSELNFNLEQDVSIKFNIGTEIYFVKTQLKKHLNKIYFDMSSKVLQLKRRKESRYLIPKKWNQSAHILNNSKALNLISCHVQDISLSGIRFEVLDQTVIFKRDDIIKFQFQIYKRAEIASYGIVRFYLNRAGHSSILGLEFFNLKEVQKERISNIVEDIVNFQTVNKF
jgi:hypothetical protein